MPEQGDVGNIEPLAKRGYSRGLVSRTGAQTMVDGRRKERMRGLNGLGKGQKQAGGIAATGNGNQNSGRFGQPLDKAPRRRENVFAGQGRSIRHHNQQARRFCSLVALVSTAFGALG